MNETHSSRPILLGILAVIILTLLIGTVHAFSSVRAAPSASRPILNGAVFLAASPTPTPRVTCAPHSLSPSPTPTTTPPPLPPAGPRSADTSGIIALSALMVAIVLFGVLWAGRKPARPPKPRQAKQKGKPARLK
jgi:hypothetical protein